MGKATMAQDNGNEITRFENRDITSGLQKPTAQPSKTAFKNTRKKGKQSYQTEQKDNECKT